MKPLSSNDISAVAGGTLGDWIGGAVNVLIGWPVVADGVGKVIGDLVDGTAVIGDKTPTTSTHYR